MIEGIYYIPTQIPFKLYLISIYGMNIHKYILKNIASDKKL